MARIRFGGPLSLRVNSFLALSKIAMATYARHACGLRMAPDWDTSFEIGIRFWRHQFTKALTHPEIKIGRKLFDSLQTETDDAYDVSVRETETPKGHWVDPSSVNSSATLLYLHGGGYTFDGAISARFAAMLAHRSGARLFAPRYRLTPEHPHPAQAADALAAWHHVTANTPADRVVVIGDSAGGNMALNLLQTLKSEGLEQPALCIGLCPWTDVGPRGDSLYANDRYDLVQGWMALRFGEWLDPGGKFGRRPLSPIAQNFRGLAPIYLQAGGREILHDMICDFADVQAAHGADIMLDVWDDMPHVFQAYDSLKQSSAEAISRLCLAINAHTQSHAAFVALPEKTRAQGGSFARRLKPSIS